MCALWSSEAEGGRRAAARPKYLGCVRWNFSPQGSSSRDRSRRSNHGPLRHFDGRVPNPDPPPPLSPPTHSHCPTDVTAPYAQAEDNAAQHTAIIKWFDRKKGFGFASPETGGDDIFVHQLNLGNNEEGKRPFLDEGDTIYYDIGDHNGRPTAINVKLPPGKGLGSPRRRTRGRNAKKELDDDAVKDGDAKVEKATDAAKAANAAPEGGAGPKPGGGRDGKTHRASNNRPRRNDKGVGGKEADKGGAAKSGGTKANAGGNADVKKAVVEAASTES